MRSINSNLTTILRASLEDEVPGQKTVTSAFMVNPENTMESAVRKRGARRDLGGSFCGKSLSKNLGADTVFIG
jgi:hypothetical protein